MLGEYYRQIEKYQEIVKEHNINLDYYPTNYVVRDKTLFYIDYECNEYSDEWNYQNWGSLYWHK